MKRITACFASSLGALALAAGAAACGGDDGGAATTTSAPAAASSSGASPTTQPAKRYKAVYQSVTESLSALPILRAIQADYFNEEGIDLEILPINSASAAVAASVDSGASAFAAAGGTGPLAAITGGQDVVAVAVTSGLALGFSCHNDTVAKLADELGVTPSSPVKERVSALKGLTLALPAAGSTTDIMIRTVIRDGGLDPDSDLSIQGIADPAAMVAAAREGKADCYAFSPPTGLLGVAEGWAQAWIMFGSGETDDKRFAGTPGLVFVTSGKYLSDNPEAVNAALRALQRATEDITSGDPKVSAEVKERWFPKLDQKVWDLSYSGAAQHLKTNGLGLDDDGFKKLLSLFNADRPQPVDVTLEQYFNGAPLSAAEAGG